ncbi:MAG: hypothetical protein II939_14080 [Bacteroidales bacterium]|nr:hypothetical protein [Bacteroidales bacterium]
MKKMILTAIAVMMSALLMNVKAQVKIGDIMEKSGTKGIVVYVDESGQHGLLMSVTHVPLKQKLWCGRNYKEERTGANSEDDGQFNTKTVVDYAKNKGFQLKEAFPLFDWCVNTCGDGWYIPSINELLLMTKNVVGVEGQGEINFVINSDSFKAFEKKLKKAKGNSMLGGSDKELLIINSSTELKRNSLGRCDIASVTFTTLFDSHAGAAAKAALSTFGFKNNSGKGKYQRFDGFDKTSSSVGTRAFYKF